MTTLELEIRKLSTLERLFHFNDTHIQELSRNPGLLHLLKFRRKELKKIQWLRNEIFQYKN